MNYFFLFLLFFSINSFGNMWEDMPWFDHYPVVVKELLKQHENIDSYLDQRKIVTVLDLWEEPFHRKPDVKAIKGLRHSLTFKKIDKKTRRLAAYLQLFSAKTIGEKRVALMMPSSPELLVSFLAVIRAGMTPMVVLTAGGGNGTRG